MNKHRVVIVGGGFGGLFAAKFLRRKSLSLLMARLIGVEYEQERIFRILKS